MPTRKRLTDAGIARLRAGAREYTVWDTGVAGLGVRVRPSGSRTFIFHRKTAAGVRKMSFGPALLGKRDTMHEIDNRFLDKAPPRRRLARRSRTRNRGLLRHQGLATS